MPASPTPAPKLILSREPLGRPWRCVDPFLFCMHHLDHYPAGNGALGPAAAALSERDIGMDFSGRDGWSMYHGDEVPGFPGHPHRGFETVTIVEQGLVDHADSLGATARYGEGDVQWLTAGRGIQHAEMFPLVHTDRDNELDLYQIWLNLPARSKMTEPAFRMLWAPDIAQVRHRDADGRETEVKVIAGDYTPVDPASVDRPGRVAAGAPPPDSWASRAEADVAIWLLRLAPGATVTLPAAGRPGSHRVLYFHRGSQLSIGDEAIAAREMVEVRSDQLLPLTNPGEDLAVILLLQGQPIGEPVAAHGPFVMNTRAELIQAVDDYQRTQFGGWPWPGEGHTHGQAGRFARFPDGRTETPSDA